MIAIFPEGPTALLSLIKLLARSTRQQLHRMGDNISIAAVDNKQVDVV
jgi:hypothetical protein